MNQNLPVGDKTIRVHTRGKLIQPAPLASIGAPRVKIERAADPKPKAVKPAPTAPASGSAAVLILLFLLLSFTHASALITPPVSGDAGGYYPTRLLYNLATSTRTNRLNYTSAGRYFGNTNSGQLNIRTNASGRWEWRNGSTVLATNTVNAPYGTWRTNYTGAAIYGYTRYEPTAPQPLQLDALGGVISPNEFWTANSGNIPHVSTNVFYVSQWPGVTAVPGASTNGGIGADSGPALQELLDQVTNYSAGIEIVRDGQFITAQTLKVRSNTKLSALNQNCGFVLSNRVSQYLMVNEPLNGNVILCSNITLTGGASFGTRQSQNRWITNGPYYDGIYSPIKGTNQVAYTVGVDEGGTHWRPWLYSVWFSGVQNLLVENEAFNESRVFALTVGNIQDGTVDNNKFWWSGPQDGSQDAIHMYTPLYNFKARGNWSNGDDDMLAFNTDELAYVTNANTRIWRGTNGGGRDALLENNTRGNGNGGFVRIISYSSTLGKNGFTNLTIRGLRGSIPDSGWIAGAVNSVYTDQKTFIDGLVIQDVKLTNNVAVGIDLINVNGTWASISDVTGYGIPSFYQAFNQFADDRFTQGYIALDTGWDSMRINNVEFNAMNSTTNVSLVSVRYPYSRKIGSLKVSNSSVSGRNVRALVANHGDISTLSLSGNTSTNSASIPDVYTAKTVTGGGTINVSRLVGATNYAEDTPLWLRKVRQLGYEPMPSRQRAVDWGLQFFQDTGDLPHMQEIGFLAGATNINEILPKIRTYWTNEFSTNAFAVNNGFTSADLTRYGLRGTNQSYLNTQVVITTNGIGVNSKTNLSVGIYVHTIASTNVPGSYAGGSYAGGTDNTWFSFQSWSPVDNATPTILTGNRYYGPVGQMTNAGLHSFTLTNSTARNIYVNGTAANTTPGWNGEGFTNGTFIVMKGQYYNAATNNIVSFWYVGDSSVNQSNVAYAARIMTEMAACYSPVSIGLTGWTNYFGGNAQATFTGGNVGITNTSGGLVASWPTATNLTFTLKPGWVIGGTGMSGVATDY